MKIDPDQIRLVIGPGGKTIRSITEQTGATIEVEDDGTVRIATNDGPSAELAMELINKLTRQPEVGEVYEGVVKRLEPYGAFVEILPNTDGLLHISEVRQERIPDIRDVLSLGDTIRVKIINIDGNDRIKLSHRVLLEEEERGRGGGDDRSGRGGDDDSRRDDRRHRDERGRDDRRRDDRGRRDARRRDDRGGDDRRRGGRGGRPRGHRDDHGGDRGSRDDRPRRDRNDRPGRDD